MRRYATWCLLAACLLLLTGAWAQEPSTSRQAASPPAARREANLLRIGNQPALLLWARGLADKADLEQYAGAGLNTVYVLVAGDSEEQLEAASELLSAAEQQELFAVVAVEPGAVHDADGNALAPDPTSEAYGDAVADLVTALAARFKDHKNLIAWSIEALPSGLFSWNDAAFVVYLQDWYDGSLSRLNESWGGEFSEWEAVTLEAARSVDAALPGGLGRGSVDYAMYRQVAYADALSLWARALRSADPGRLVFASALTDYRSIISVPSGFDGLVLNTYPSVAEMDLESHNVHAVDIARRGNRFAAIPTFWVDRDLDPVRTANWMNQALLHGAAGLGFSSWSPIQESEEMQGAIKDLAEAVRSTRLLPAQPVARAAVLYQPIAGGAMRNGQGLYGYLDGVTPDEPTTLFAVARGGTRYGLLDVLATSSLREADLQQYGVIFAPMVLSLPDDQQLALHNFVLQGGAVVTDAGIGMYQGAGTLDSMPPVVAEMLGMRYAEAGASAQADEFGSAGEPGGAGQPGIAVPVGPGEAGLAMDSDLARFADVLEQFLGRPDVRKYLGEEFISEEGPGFRVRALGRGFSVYAPTFLYATWGPADPYFNEFHDRILSWQRDLEVIEPEGIWPPVGAAIYRDWSVGLASPEGLVATVDLYDRRNQMYLVPLGAMRVANPEEDQRIELLFPGARLAVARPVPVYLRTFDEEGILTASLIRYDATGIELEVHGSGAVANPTRAGIGISGGDLTNIEIEIHDGAYRLAAGSMHRVVLEEGLRARRREETMMPNRDTGLLVIQVPVSAARITIEPAPER